ncbi:hypothetical protein [Mesorhizobium sp. ANAO-SY3R2]|uniref:hypothetical protein n=1 Tax=Mesorhizobium sp. ANAO-SY3R2 TaxID=3166644 RepID=UPI00366D8F49
MEGLSEHHEMGRGRGQHHELDVSSMLSHSDVGPTRPWQISDAIAQRRSVPTPMALTVIPKSGIGKLT